MSTQATSEVRQRDAASLDLRHDWTRQEVEADLSDGFDGTDFPAQTVHRQRHAPDRVQTCQLISIKTGGCPEDCGYCPQSAHYDAPVEREGLLDPQHVIGVAREACRPRSDALLYGRGVEAGAGRRGVRTRIGDGARSFGAGVGSLLHAGDAE